MELFITLKNSVTVRLKSDTIVDIELIHFQVTVIMHLPSHNFKWETQISITYLTVNLNKCVTWDLFLKKILFNAMKKKKKKGYKPYSFLWIKSWKRKFCRKKKKIKKSMDQGYISYWFTLRFGQPFSKQKDATVLSCRSRQTYAFCRDPPCFHINTLP